MSSSVPEVTLYTRKNCHLCEEAKTVLARVSRRSNFRLREVDIDSDPELVRRFNDDVPVVFVRGEKAFRYRVDERTLLQLLNRE